MPIKKKKVVKRIVFSFEDLTAKSAAVKKIKNRFEKLGVKVANVEVPDKMKRTLGVTYREVFVLFEDHQTVTFCIKKTGDIFQIKLNGKAIPIHDQDNQEAAIAEIAERVSAGSSTFLKKWQKKYANITVPAPKKQGTAVVKREQVLLQKKTDIKAARDELAAMVRDLTAKLESLRSENKALEREIG